MYIFTVHIIRICSVESIYWIFELLSSLLFLSFFFVWLLFAYIKKHFLFTIEYDFIFGTFHSCKRIFQPQFFSSSSRKSNRIRFFENSELNSDAIIFKKEILFIHTIEKVWSAPDCAKRETHTIIWCFKCSWITIHFLLQFTFIFFILNNYSYILFIFTNIFIKRTVILLLLFICVFEIS